MPPTDRVLEVIPTDPDNPHPLGRTINHDPRSADYPYRPRKAVQVVTRNAWPTGLPILEQRLGSCVPNTGVEWLATDHSTRPALSTVDSVRPGGSEAIDLTDALEAERWIEDPETGLYHLVTNRDPFLGAFPPNDTGSDGTTLGNLFVELGWVESFEHAFGGLGDVLSGLMEGPVWIGTNWYSSMFDTNSDDELVISPGAWVAGGHQFLLTGAVDTMRQRVEMRNHWRYDWGRQGKAWMSYALIERLLDEQGDAQIVRPKVNVVPPFPGSPPETNGCLGMLLPASMRRRLGGT